MNSGRKVISTRTRQALHPLDQQIERLEGRGIDPVHVLVDREHRLLGRQALDLVDQDLEGALLLALRAQRQGRVALAGLDPEQGSDERHRLAERLGGLGEQRFELVEPGLGPIVAAEAGRALQEADHGIERAVGVVRRAVVTERRVGLVREPLAQCAHDPRLADPRLAREQHHLALALLGALPSIRSRADLVLAADQRRELLAVHGLEAALGSTLAEHPPGRNRLGEALELAAGRDRRTRTGRRPVAARRLARSPRCRARPDACSRAARFGVSPTTASSCAAPSPIRSPTTTCPVAIPTRAA